MLELLVVNRGNVTETLDRGRVRIFQRGTSRASVAADARPLRPRTSGIVRFRYRGRLRGWVTVQARIAAEPGGPRATRTFRIKL